MVPVIVGGFVIAAGVGTTVYELFFRKPPESSISKKTLGTVGPSPGSAVHLPILNQKPPTDAPTHTIPVSPPVIIGKTPGGNTLVSISPTNPATGQTTVVHKVATGGSAAPAAHALYDYFKLHGTDDGHSAGLVKDFQKANNADPDAKLVAGGKLSEDGKYGPATSAALTIYTGDPIPPHSAAAPIPTPTTSDLNDPNRKTSLPSAAAASGSNLYAYLKQNGNDGSATEKKLVKLFQHDVNTDPQFPGPAFAWPGGKKIVTKPLVEDGSYGPKSADALAAITYSRIDPNGTDVAFTGPKQYAGTSDGMTGSEDGGIDG